MSEKKNRQETLASSKLLVFSEGPLSEKYVVRRQLIQKQKMPKKIVHEKKNHFFWKYKKFNIKRRKQFNKSEKVAP